MKGTLSPLDRRKWMNEYQSSISRLGRLDMKLELML